MDEGWLFEWLPGDGGWLASGEQPATDGGGQGHLAGGVDLRGGEGLGGLDEPALRNQLLPECVDRVFGDDRAGSGGAGGQAGEGLDLRVGGAARRRAVVGLGNLVAGRVHVG